MWPKSVEANYRKFECLDNFDLDWYFILFVIMFHDIVVLDIAIMLTTVIVDNKT